MIAIVAFAIGLVTAGVLLVGVVVSLIEPGPRLWPHGEKDWSYRVHFGCWIVHVPAFVVAAAGDAGSLFAPGPVATAAGIVLLVAGLTIGVVAFVQLGVATSTGMPTELYTDGLYRYSRNPQTVGFAAAFAGAVVVSGSLFALVLAAVDVVVLLLAAWVEEPWLREQYGEVYERYREETPRFVGPVARS